MNIPFPSFFARRAKPSLIVNGKDLLASVAAENILSFVYTDNTSDKADDLSISLADPKRTWMQIYLPAKGIETQANLVVNGWTNPFDNRTFFLGTFFIDNVGMHGPPNQVDIKATSIPTNTGIKTQKKNRSWENSDLQSIVSQIAGDNNLKPFYDTQKNPLVKRTDQVESADIQYVRERAKENGLSVKIHNKQLIIYSEEEYEQRAPIYTIAYGSSNVLSWDFNSKCDDTYNTSENSYVNPETGKLTTESFTPSKPPEGVNSTLKLNEKVEFRKDGLPDYGVGSRLRSLPDYDFTQDAAAQNAGKGEGAKEESVKKCKAKLREKNKKEKTCLIKVVGNINLMSGLNVQLTNWGVFDGKWFIESSVHSLGGSGYTCDLHLRTALEGY